MTHGLKEMSERIRAAWQKSGKSWDALAHEIGVSVSHLHRVGRGQNDPSAITLGRFADATGVSADWLLGRTKKETGYAGATDLQPPTPQHLAGEWLASFPVEVRQALEVIAPVLQQQIERALQLQRNKASGKNVTQDSPRTERKAK